MGNRVAKQERERRNNIKKEIFNKAITESEKKYTKETNALTINDFIQDEKVSNLKRQGGNFIKSDLIAILMHLTNVKENSKEFYQYQTLSCDDLRAFIRLILYSPQHISSNLITNNNTNNTNNKIKIEEVDNNALTIRELH